MNVGVIDDDAAFLRSIEILLSGKGHRVVAFKDPEKALPVLSRASMDGAPPIDVLVVDYVLSRCTALDFLQAHRSCVEHCRVILVSGHTDRVECLDLRTIGVDAFLPKPLDFDRLCELIENENGAKAP